VSRILTKRHSSSQCNGQFRGSPRLFALWATSSRFSFKRTLTHHPLQLMCIFPFPFQMINSGRPDAVETAIRVMSMVFDRIMVQFEVSPSASAKMWLCMVSPASKLLDNF
jgi:hypothetical protein